MKRLKKRLNYLDIYIYLNNLAAFSFFSPFFSPFSTKKGEKALYTGNGSVISGRKPVEKPKKIKGPGLESRKALYLGALYPGFTVATFGSTGDNIITDCSTSPADVTVEGSNLGMAKNFFK